MGTCANGMCSYTPISTACIAPMQGTAVCTSNACDFNCDAGDTKSGAACVSSALAPSAIAVGARHACALLSSGVWCWGYDGYGQLGTGSTSPLFQTTPVAVTGLGSDVTAISVGDETSCAIVSGGVWCWGYDGDQQLGSGATTSATPVAVQGLSSGVTAISVGLLSSCAIADGGVQCWGTEYVRRASATTPPRPAPHRWPVQGLSSGVTAISVGTGYACAVAGGGVQCWGQNPFTVQSSVPTEISGWSANVTSVSVGEDAICTMQDGAAQCFGDNNAGQIGNQSNQAAVNPVAVQGLSSGVTAISAGNETGCAVLNGGVQCWGNNQDGQLGNGTVAASSSPVAVSGLSMGASAVAVGNDENGNYVSACAIVSGGVQCWGYGEYGELGNGSNTNSDVPVAVQF